MVEWRDEFDNPESNLTRTRGYIEGMLQNIFSRGREYVIEQTEFLRKMAEEVDKSYPSLPGEEAKVGYIFRINHCNQQFKYIDDILNNQEATKADLINAISPLGFLFGELTGLRYTMQKYGSHHIDYD